MAAVSKVIQFPQKEKKEPGKRHTPRADGLFQVELRYKDQNGVSKKKSFYGKSHAEAKKKRKDFERDLEAGLSPDASKITLKAYGDSWLKKQEVKYKKSL